MARTSASAAAAANRKAAVESGKPNPNQKMLDALNAERQGYVQRGLPERVKQVDAQIKHYGGSTPTAAELKAEAEKVAAEKAEAEKAAADAQAAAELKAEAEKVAAENAEAKKAAADADK